MKLVPDKGMLTKKWLKIDKTIVKDIAVAVVEAAQGDNKAVFIGTDSQMHDHKQEYVTAIVVYTEGKGGTTFHTKTFTGEPRSLREKLVNEAWLSVYTAWEIEKVLPAGVDLAAIHLDVNPDKRWASSKYHDEIYGLVKGQGFEVVTKPGAWVASYVAEFIAKHRNEAA